MERNNNLAQVFHFDLYGKRSEKYDFLLNNTLQTIPWHELELSAPQFFFVKKDFSLKEEYEKGFSVQEMFPVNSVGIVTARDNFTIHNIAQDVINTINEFIKLDVETARSRFNLGKDARDWSVSGALKDLTQNPDFRKIVEINYRPFDKRFTYYTGKSKGFHCMPRGNVMQHFVNGENVGLMLCRQQKTNGFYHCLIHDKIVESSFVSNKTSEIGYSFPLYLYPEIENQTSPDYGVGVPNLKPEMITIFAEKIGLKYELERNIDKNSFAPIDLLDYIYAVLHSPTYRERYKEFLKIDFPRVPYPENAEQFWALVALGGKLRKLHLMEGIEPQEGMATYPQGGTHEVEKPLFVRHSELVSESPENKEIAGQARNDGRVYINDSQYFDNVPLVAWNFYIGGYQPAQKWLKDRKGKKLNNEDVSHYRKIIRVLVETQEVMEAATNFNPSFFN